MGRRHVVVASLIAAALTACGSSSMSGTATSSSVPGRDRVAPSGVISPGARYHPTIDPVNFRSVVDNPWFPLRPGTTYIYEGMKDGEPSRDVYVVDAATKRIDGVSCVVISDQLFLSGTLFERTTDYYTQDLNGNVWYFGEKTAELDKHGKVTSTEGSWLAGRHGAQPGLFMEADPVVGHAYRQEYYQGHAEDQYRVLNLSTPVKVPFGAFNDALLTEETTALEPGTLDHKYYVRGIGEVAELSVDGPAESGRLVSYHSG